MTYLIPRPNWVSERLVAERGHYAGFQMYTREGNNAVGVMLATALSLAERLSATRPAVIDAVRNGIREVAKDFPEVHDTEPRGMVYDTVDHFFAEQGWLPVTEDLFR